MFPSFFNIFNKSFSLWYGGTAFIIALAFLSTACDKEVEDPIATIPLSKVATKIEVKAVLLSEEDLKKEFEDFDEALQKEFEKIIKKKLKKEKEEVEKKRAEEKLEKELEEKLDNKKLKDAKITYTLHGKDFKDPSKAIAGYVYGYVISKKGYTTKGGTLRAVHPDNQKSKKVSIDTVSVKVTAYQSSDKITIISVADTSGTPKAGAVAMDLKSGTAKKMKPADAGYYKVTLTPAAVGATVKDSIINLVDTSRTLTIATGYYLELSTVPTVADAVVTLKNGTKSITHQDADGKYFVSIADTGTIKVEVAASVALGIPKKRSISVKVNTQDVSKSIYLYTEMDVYVSNPAAVAPKVRIVRVDKEGVMLAAKVMKNKKEVDNPAHFDQEITLGGSGMSYSKSEKIDSATYYKVITKPVTDYLGDSAMVHIMEVDGYKKVSLALRKLHAVMFKTKEVKDSVKLSSVIAFKGGKQVMEYKTDKALGVTVPTKYAVAKVDAKIPTSSTGDVYYMVKMVVKTAKKDDKAKTAEVRVVLDAAGGVTFYGTDGQKYKSGVLAVGMKMVTFDYTKL